MSIRVAQWIIGIGLFLMFVAALVAGMDEAAGAGVESFTNLVVPKCQGGMYEVDKGGRKQCCDTRDCRNTTRSCVLSGDGANCADQQSAIASDIQCPPGQRGVLGTNGESLCQSPETNLSCVVSGATNGALSCESIRRADCPRGQVPARRNVAGIENVLVCERRSRDATPVHNDWCVATQADVTRIRAERPEIVSPGPGKNHEGRDCAPLRIQPSPQPGAVPMYQEHTYTDATLTAPIRLRYHHDGSGSRSCLFSADKAKLKQLLDAGVITKRQQDTFVNNICPEST